MDRSTCPGEHSEGLEGIGGKHENISDMLPPANDAAAIVCCCRLHFQSCVYRDKIFFGHCGSSNSGLSKINFE